ncbi:hypothetical protein Rvan_0139 [Rhodomicrobium vannielii ATCC 17100]|uniref:Uncharacterized protein n=1 Tax=Rhodomicrobium vannielii (strain ATCC 17100 / DSM 162 / LMG 4299 / NCIMB 10020 / ATH 3.1.1) TaxID=648757 RepID=E3I5S6_RHOVT|nr:hypothetical protein [Rhodomicrobium vannielii]ADP69429.1 hypothetical protein Rvan_0139 [Rhodomicrobium vannielii ATCC 17100]
MNPRLSLVFAIAILAAPTPAAVQAFGQVADSIGYIATAPISGLPKGLYKDWTDDEKGTAFKRIGGFCQFLCVDSFGNTTFPNVAAADRARAEAKLCLQACVVGHLPRDYPNRDAMKEDLRVAYDAARKQGSAVAWPLPKE